MTTELLAGLASLALVDALNPATIAAVALVLIAVPHRPGLIAGLAALGAACTVFLAGATLFVSAGAAAGAVDGFVLVLRFVAFAAAGAVIIRAGIRRLRPRKRRGISLPSWFNVWTAPGFGALLTAADLPNAFPYFIAIERMLTSQVTAGAGLLVLAGYTVIYCMPCLVLLAVGTVVRRRVQGWLTKIVRRFSTGEVPRSVFMAVTLITLGTIVATIPLWLL